MTSPIRPARGIDRRSASEASIAGQHEVALHPVLVDRERLDHGAHAGKQSMIGGLEGRIGALPIDIEPQQRLRFEFRGRDARCCLRIYPATGPRLPGEARRASWPRRA